MLNVFIGSSTEARKTVLEPFLERMSAELKDAGLADHVMLNPWSVETKHGATSFDEILVQLNKSDAGVFFFTNDEHIESRGEKLSAPRDNVVLEVGMWAARLGLDRTFIFVEEGAKEPSDFFGRRFWPLGGTPSQRAIDFTKRCQQLAELFKAMEPMRAGERQRLLEEFALGGTLANSQADLMHIEQDLVAGKWGKALAAPIHLGTETCLNAYIEALRKVEREFLTTTSFDSGFWRSRNSDTMDTNKNMLARIKGNGGDARRIFLLPARWDDFLKREEEKYALLRRNGDVEAMQNKAARLETISEVITDFHGWGCDVRFVFDEKNVFRKLTEEVQQDLREKETEIAVLDDFRIDLYRAGEAPHISSLLIYPSVHRTFETHRTGVRAYFNALWEQGGKEADALPLLEQWRGKFKRWESRIDYDSNWIADYEWSLNLGDRAVKEGEFAAVEKAINQLRIRGAINSYLDIGTCTARYPIGLCHAGVFAEGATLFALDEDADCIRFSERKIAAEPKLGHQIQVKKGDFLGDLPDAFKGRTFELITCMLGTISHFGGPGSNPSEAEKRQKLEEAIGRMNSFLSDDGTLLIGNWSEAARGGQLLVIYSADNSHRLSAWTPTREQMKSVAENVGLKVDIAEAHNRLDLYICRRAPPKRRRRAA